MTPEQRTSLVVAIHAAAPVGVVALTGGGAQALADLLCVPGASRTLLEAVVPYAEASLAELLGSPPEQAVSAGAAAGLAAAALARAGALAEPGAARFGLGATAALATDRPKKGEHRAHVAVLGAAGGRGYELTLDKGARGRAEEDRLVSDLVLAALAHVCGLAPPALELGPRDLLVERR